VSARGLTWAPCLSVPATKQLYPCLRVQLALAPDHRSFTMLAAHTVACELLHCRLPPPPSRRAWPTHPFGCAINA
jgi:hypothetical protein